MSNTTMSSRERFYKAVNHEEPDRIPINFGGCAQSTLLHTEPKFPAVTKLYEHLGITDFEYPVTGPIANQVYNMDERVMERFGSDFRLIMPNGGPIDHHEDGSITIRGVSCGLRARRIGIYDDIFEHPLTNITTKKGIEEYPYWPTDEDFKNLAEGKIEEIKKLHEETDKVILEDLYKPYPHLIDIGVEILNPVQPLAKNMEPWRLKKEFGKDLTFFGGIDTQQLLYRNEQEVRDGVRDVIRSYAPGGGFIFAGSHNIEPDTPTENILAMFETALEYGKYPIR